MDLDATILASGKREALPTCRSATGQVSGAISPLGCSAWSWAWCRGRSFATATLSAIRALRMAQPGERQPETEDSEGRLLASAFLAGFHRGPASAPESVLEA